MKLVNCKVTEEQFEAIELFQANQQALTGWRPSKTDIILAALNDYFAGRDFDPWPQHTPPRRRRSAA